jgi:hypothetical protein
MSDYIFTDSTTNNSLKDNEQKENPFLDFNYNQINTSNNEQIEEVTEFEKPEHKIKWDIKMQNTYHFKHDIERVWFIVRNFDVLCLFNNEGHYPCVNIKGKCTWKVGNIFKGNFYKIFPFIARVEKVVSLPEIKEVKWLFKSINDKFYFSIKFDLYKVTEDNSTVCLKDVKFEKILNNNLNGKLQDFNSNEVLKIVDGLLENEVISLLRYESGIIKGKMEDIYNVLIDSNKLSAIAPNNHIMPNFSIKDLKLNEKRKVTIVKNDEVGAFDVTLKCKEINPGWNKWIIVIEISGGEPKKIPRHTSLFQLTKINNYECQLIMLTKYHEPISCQDFHEYTMKKKYLIMSLKDYFDNFYSPDSSN